MSKSNILLYSNSCTQRTYPAQGNNDELVLANYLRSNVQTDKARYVEGALTEVANIVNKPHKMVTSLNIIDMDNDVNPAEYFTVFDSFKKRTVSIKLIAVA